MSDMKKFSSISGEKVNQEPKIQKSDNQELDSFKSKIMSLMDHFLTIRSNGSVRAEHLNNSVSISGKEFFIEALVNLLSKNNLNESVKILESMKSETHDWLMIDNKINELNQEIQDKNLLIENFNLVRGLNGFLIKYGQNIDFEVVLENYTKRIKNSKEAYKRSIIAEKMSNDVNLNITKRNQLRMISEKFLQRAKKLSF